jgi:hypothetical protein
MSAMAGAGPDADVLQVLTNILAELRRINKLLAEIRDLEASRSR